MPAHPLTAMLMLAGIGGGIGTVNAQQQVHVSVIAAPNPISAGTCTRVSADVRDELGRPLVFEGGVALQWSSYDFAASNSVDFEWRSTPTGEFELCAKPGAGPINTQLSATVKGTTYSGTTVLTVGIATAAAAGAAIAIAPTVSPPSSIAPAQPSTPPAGPAYIPPAGQPPAPPAPQPYTPAAGQPSSPAAEQQSYTPTAQPYAAAAATLPPPPPATPAEKRGGGFFTKIGSHIKQRALEVKTETTQNLMTAATGVVDTAFQTGSSLVASTTAELTSTARMGIGGVGRR